jgi:hypothetical protein
VINIVRRDRAGLCGHVPYPASVLSEKFPHRFLPFFRLRLTSGIELLREELACIGGKVRKFFKKPEHLSKISCFS